MQQPEPTSSFAIPGRMAPNSAVAFLLVGLALLLISRRRPIVEAAQSLAVITWLISFVGLLGYVYGSVYFYTADSHTGMALHGAIAFQLLSVGVLCTVPDRGIMLVTTGSGIGSLITRRLLPVVIVLPPLIGGFASVGHLYSFMERRPKPHCPAPCKWLFLLG